MPENADNLEHIALDLIERFRNVAAPIARVLATASDGSVCFTLCVPFSKPLIITWPLTDCSTRCPMQCGCGHSDIDDTERKTFRRFEANADHISCKLVAILNQHQHDPHSAETWREIADAIDRLSLKL